MNAPALTLAALRAEFDEVFARAPAPGGAAPDKLLLVRAGAHPYALRLAQIGGLYAGRRIMPLPSALPALLGVSGFRGQIAPVYDLAALLGQAAAAAPRWLLLVRCAQPLALAFDAFDGHCAAAPGHILNGAPDPARPWLGATLQDGQGGRPLIDLAALYLDIQQQAAPALRERSCAP